MSFRLRALFILTAAVALPFAFGPPYIAEEFFEINRNQIIDQRHVVYERNTMFWAVALIEAIIGCIAFLVIRRR